jgi:hypothetical protein
MKCCKNSTQKYDFSFPDNGNLPCPLPPTAQTFVFHVLPDKSYCPVFRSPSTADENIPQSHPTPSSTLHNPRILTFTSNLETLFPSPTASLISLAPTKPSKLPPNAATAEIEGLEGGSTDIRTGRRKSKLEHQLLVTLTAERNLPATIPTNHYQ